MMPSLIGQSIGRYEILEQLGEGGMATVYKARDTRLERFVAIKVIRTDQFAPSLLDEILKRFEREAKALAMLSHPYIVPVHDYGEFDGTPFLVMEYLPCGTLKERPAGAMPWQQAVHTLLPIAQALAYAHEHNVIHRDIKPGNILLTEKGLPLLSDFGIAKILEGNKATTLTGAGLGIGTPEYMAPEQWTGQSSPQSDIYSLAVVLYELVTGRKPYTADTPAGIMLKQVHDPLPLPRQFVPDLPEELENILLKALARQPEERQHDMGEFSAALEALAGGQTLVAGMKKVDLPAAGGTMLAPAGSRLEAAMASSSTGGVNMTGAGLMKEIPPAPEKKRQMMPINLRRWIPVGVLGLVLFIGIFTGAGMLIKGWQGRGDLAAPNASPTLVVTPTQLVLQPVNGSSPSLTSAAGVVKVLWDTSHGPRKSGDGSLYTPDGMYQSLAKLLGISNFIVYSGDLSNLESYDILVISELSGTKAYTNVEANEIDRFVRSSGHGLLLLSDTPDYENLADIVARKFSISLGEFSSAGPASLANEPFFAGVSSIPFPSGGGIFLLSTPSQTAASDNGGSTVIAYCECDAGRVMAISDANLWDNDGLVLGDNKLFATNVFTWLAKRSP
jgi:tRNA A-37 threonylcarbamoyl transferase component Bud32